MNEAAVGARARIKPHSNYHGCFAGECGEIVRVYEDSIAVRLDGICNLRSKYGAYWFAEKEIEMIESEEFTMCGNYVTANVAFLNGTNTDKTYRYALYDSTIQPGDLVVAQTGHHGLVVARMVSIDSEANGPVTHGREIICKVDMAAFDERKEKAEKLVELKARMDSKVRQLQQNAIYEMMAEKDPELAEMLEVYKSLQPQEVKTM